MWLHKLKKKRLQFTLIGVILFLSAAIFSACLCFTAETGSFANNYFSKNNCPDVFLNVKAGTAADKLISQAKKNSDFTRVTVINSYKYTGKLTLNGEDITPYFYFFYALPDYHALSWSIKPVSGKTMEKGPAANEVWITGVYADQKGIKLGDKICLQNNPEISLTVSAIVNDTFCPSSTFGVYTFYVNQSTLSAFSGGIPGKLMAVSSKTNYSDVEAWLHNQPFDVTNALISAFNVSQLIMSSSMFEVVLGSIGMLSAFMIFTVTIVIIRFLIKNNLLKEYRAIGIYKALGFTNRQIAGFYYKCYTFVGAAALALGALAGLPLGYIIGSEITRYIGLFRLSYISALLVPSGAALLFLLLLLFVWHAHRKIKNVTPVEAIRIGVTSSPKKLTRSVIKNAYSPVSSAINDICKHRSLSLMFVLILTVSFYLCMFFLSINYTCGHIGQNADIWFGIPRADCYCTGSLTPKTIDEIKTDPAVSDCLYGNPILDASIKTESNRYNVNFNESSVVSWSDFSSKSFSKIFRSGRPPENINEIAVSGGTIKGSALEIGDYITLTIGSVKKSYLVTGIYDNMMHAQKSIEMTPQALDECGVSMQSTTIAVHLKHKSDYEAFAQRIKQKYGLTTDNDLISLKDSIAGIEKIEGPVTAILVIVFAIFSVVNIINLLLTTQLDNRRRFGILKAMGFSSLYISTQNICKTLILSLISVGLAIALHFIASPPIFFSFLGVNALTNSPAQLIAAIGSILGCIVIITLLFCIPLNKISPVELMEE